MRLFFAALALMSSVAVAAPPCSVPGLPSINNVSYHQARSRLIEAGFIPAITPTDANLSAIVDEPRRLFGYGEVSDCSGTGYGGCVYNWRSPKGQAFNIYAREAYGQIRAAKNPIKCGLNDPYNP